jgi:hypothetical protein
VSLAHRRFSDGRPWLLPGSNRVNPILCLAVLRKSRRLEFLGGFQTDYVALHLLAVSAY